MAMRNWHYGKLIILWSWGVAVVALLSEALPSERTTYMGLILMALIFGILLVLSITTWKWLGKKETRDS